MSSTQRWPAETEGSAGCVNYLLIRPSLNGHHAVSFMSCGFLVTTLFLAVVSLTAAADSSPAENAPADGHSFLDQYCVKCHGSDAPKADLNLEPLAEPEGKLSHLAVWQQVLEKLENNEMPPKSKPRPPADERRAALDWIYAEVTKAKAEQRATEGRVVLRRLNRTEYENTVRDLLRVEVHVRDLLPEDSSAGGFDNVGDALHTSSFLLARYLEAAEAALDQAIASQPRPKETTKRVSVAKEAYQVRGSEADVFRKRDGGGVVMFSSAEWLGASLFYIDLRGRYRFRMSVSGVQSEGKPVVFRVQSGGGGMGGAKAHLVGYFDAPADATRVIEFEDFMEPKTGIFMVPYGLGNPSALKKMGAEAWTGPGLSVDWVEMIGPLNDVWPPLSHQRLFGDLKQVSIPNPQRGPRLEVTSDDPPADVQRILERFARRAFRRPANTEEIAPYVALVMKRLAQGSSFEYATRAGLAALMTSPQFLFLREKPGQLDDYALASRLAYFLWSSMPDDALLDAAEKGALSQPEVLRAQVERMLQGPKAAEFTENFTGQWLRLRDIDFTEPSQQLYPEFDDMLKASMLREAHLFFDEVLKSDLSITHFLASDFAMLNGRLARHYGIPGVNGWEFQRVALPPESRRGGVLTMGAVLKVTANGTNTSPVLRGAWVLDRILGTPPKPPPPDAGTIEPDIRGATTMREQLAKHRRNETCNSCHAKIDPPGFALENFDVIGGWREYYRSTGNGKSVEIDGRRMPYLQGKPVDAGDVLPDGRKFANIDEFKQLLLADPDQFARALSTKLLTYATGGVIEPSDQREIDAIVAKAKANHLGFRTLIHEIVQSPLFREK